jgi:hydroxyethylthiazole kinase
VAAAQNLARRAGSVVAVSGAVDYITDGDTIVQVHTGHELMTRVTGVGCALGALVAACCAVTKSSLMAASAGTAILTVAAQVAASHTDGPGSFAVALLDELYALKPSTLEAHLMAGAR